MDSGKNQINTELEAFLLTADMLKEHNRLRDMKIPEGTLVILVKREDEYLIPNGQMELQINDKILVLRKKYCPISLCKQE